MASYEKYQIIGNLGRDPELRYTQSGVPVVSFSVAVTENWTDKQTGEKREKTKWVRVTAWKRLAEVCNELLRKGSSVFCEGTIEEPNAYLDKEGNPAASTEMTAWKMLKLDSHNQSSSTEQADDDSMPF